MSTKHVISFSKKVPLHIRNAFLNAKFMGEGVSSKAWNLKDGRVVKLTNDHRVLTLSELLVKHPKQGLAATLLVIRDCVTYNDQSYSIVVQKYYPKPKPSQWAPIEKALSTLPGSNWCEASIKIANKRQAKFIHALKTLHQNTTDAAHVLMPYASAFAVLGEFCETLRHWDPDAGMDIQRIQNWGTEAGRLIPFDPVA